MAPDTLAVVMNYISGLFVISFGLGLIKEVTSRIMDSINLKSNDSSKKKQKTEETRLVRECLECGHIGVP